MQWKTTWPNITFLSHLVGCTGAKLEHLRRESLKTRSKRYWSIADKLRVSQCRSSLGVEASFRVRPLEGSHTDTKANPTVELSCLKMIPVKWKRAIKKREDGFLFFQSKHPPFLESCWREFPSETSHFNNKFPTFPARYEIYLSPPEY
jgi:hypothetical protein